MSALDALALDNNERHEGEQETNTERGPRTGMQPAVQVLPLLIDAIFLVVDPWSQEICSLTELLFSISESICEMTT